ncbi:MAG: branched-chain amino acid ABC transporter, partial [Paraburkholderia sp.]
WNIIFFAAITALVFRVLPLAFHRSSLLSNKDGSVYRFLNYSSQAMMGYIVFDSSFGSQDITTWTKNFHGIQALQLTLLALCFIWIVCTRRQLTGLLLFMGIYAVGILAVGGA